MTLTDTVSCLPSIKKDIFEIDVRIDRVRFNNERLNDKENEIRSSSQPVSK